MMNQAMKTFPRWMGVTLAVVLLAMITSGAWFYHSQKQALQQIIEAQLSSIGRLKADQIAAWRMERLADAAVLTESPFFARGMARFVADPRDANARSFILRFKSLQLHYHYADVQLVDPQGRVLLHMNKPKALNEVCSAALATALRQRKPVLSELYVGVQNPVPQLSAISPIFDGDAPEASPLGAVILVIDASRFLYPLIQSWPTPSKTAETVLLRRDGEAALFLNELRHKPDTALHLRIPLSRTDVPAVMAVLGRQGMFRGKDYRGVEVLAVLLPVPDSPWFIESKQDATEVFAEVRLHSLLILAMYLVMVAGFGAIGLFAWQRRKKVHYQALYLSEAKLRESERKFQLLFENMTTGFALHEMIYDPNGRPLDYRFIEVNPAFERLTGVQARNWIGRTIKEVAPNIEQYWIDIYGKVAQSGEPVSYQNYARQFDRYYDVWAFSPAKDLFAVMVSDITERKQAEEAIRRNQLKKVESLHRMAGGIAHHYNNLMTVVMGNLELALAQQFGKSGTAEDLAAALTAARRASELGVMMLTYLGLTVIQRQPLDLSETCLRFFSDLRAGMPDKVILETDFAEPGPLIKADAGQIHQMLRSLVVNAWEAMDDGPGTICLSVRRATPADIVGAHRRPVEFQPKACGYACLEVKDTGCGIAQEDFEKLFDPFYTTKFTGRGLGLSLVLGAVKAHEGCVTVKSEPGRGSIFRIFLPLEIAAQTT